MAAHRRGSAAPPTRWEQTVTGDHWDFYAEKFERHVADGDDLEGEARFLDALAPRNAQILDGGTGTGRVAAALTRMGHRALGVDRDGGLLDRARAHYPGVPYLRSDLLELDPDVLADEGFAGPFDIVALPGNVLVYVAPGTEREVLETAHRLLTPTPTSTRTSVPPDSPWSTGSRPGTSTRGPSTPTGTSAWAAAPEDRAGGTAYAPRSGTGRSLSREWLTQQRVCRVLGDRTSAESRWGHRSPPCGSAVRPDPAR